MATISVLAWGQENAPVITAEAGMLSPGGTAPLTISLTNEGDDTYNGFQFDVLLPDGVMLDDNDGKGFTCEFTDRYNRSGMSSSVRDLGEGRYRVICFSMSNVCITGHEGPIAKLTLKGADDLEVGEVSGNLTEVFLSRLDGRSIDCSESQFPIMVSRTMRGDVDFSRKVDVTDVMLVVSYILGEIYPQFHFKYADMDGNGKVDVTDAMSIVEIILGNE